MNLFSAALGYAFSSLPFWQQRQQQTPSRQQRQNKQANVLMFDMTNPQAITGQYTVLNADNTAACGAQLTLTPQS